MRARIALMGGMGYPVTETPWGMPKFKERLDALGAETILVNWSHRQDIYNFMNGYDGFRGYCGDSLGAGSAAQYPGDIKGVVNFVGGFQPSNYDARTSRGLITVAANVIYAHAFYDSRWVDTLGLGNSQYIKAHGSKTVVLNTDHAGAHPDDWGFTQDVMFNELKALLEPHK